MYTSYKEFGFEVLQYIDRQFLYEAGMWSVRTYQFIKSRKKAPLDWNGATWPEYYSKQDDLFWISGKDGKKLYLPQSVVIGPSDAHRFHNEIKVSLLDSDFTPPYKNDECLGYYLKKNSFNEVCARITDYDADKKELTFQGCHYFDWVATNLSMDFSRKPLETLREEGSANGVLQALDESPLGNITGINGLIFTNDGYMIYQKRNNRVLVRPGQLCSGFSGTVDKIDIENIIQLENPVLSHIDCTREAVEEIGIKRSHVTNIAFLGLTRELIRGGTPELFYSVDIGITKNEVMSLIPKDKEGVVKAVQFGKFARSDMASTADLKKTTLWQLLDQIEKESKAPISIPMLTNLMLWYWGHEERNVGIGYREEQA